MSLDRRSEPQTDALARGRGNWPSHPGTATGAEELGNELPVSTRRAAPTERPRQRQTSAPSRSSVGPFGAKRQTGVPPPREQREWGGGGGGGASALGQRLSALFERSSALTVSAGKSTSTGDCRCPFHWSQPQLSRGRASAYVEGLDCTSPALSPLVRSAERIQP